MMKRAKFVLLALVLATCACGSFQGSPVNAPPVVGEWPMPGYDSFHRGYNPAVLARPRGSVKWRFAAPGGIWSPPVVAHGLVYAVSENGAVYALNANSGTIRWRFEMDRGRRGYLAVSHSRLYVGTEDDRYTSVYALDSLSGGLLWRYDLDRHVLLPNALPPSLPSSTGAVLTADDDTVYFQAEIQKGGDLHLSTVYALDAATGKERWHFTPNRGMGYHFFFSPSVDERRVYVAVDRPPILYALDRSTGTEVWRYEGNGAEQITNLVAIGERDVFFTTTEVGERGYVCALDREEGSLRWKTAVGQDVVHMTPPCTDGAQVYVGTGKGEVIAIDAATGLIRWNAAVRGAIVLAFPFSIAGESVYVPTAGLTAFTTDGSLLWQLGMGESADILGSPAVVDGMIFVAAGRLMAIE